MRHLIGSSIKGFLAMADTAHCLYYMFHVNEISRADHMLVLPDSAQDMKGLW